MAEAEFARKQFMDWAKSHVVLLACIDSYLSELDDEKNPARYRMPPTSLGLMDADCALLVRVKPWFESIQSGARAAAIRLRMRADVKGATPQRTRALLNALQTSGASGTEIRRELASLATREPRPEEMTLEEAKVLLKKLQAEVNKPFVPARKKPASPPPTLPASVARTLYRLWIRGVRLESGSTWEEDFYEGVAEGARLANDGAVYEASFKPAVAIKRARLASEQSALSALLTKPARTRYWLFGERGYERFEKSELESGIAALRERVRNMYRTASDFHR